MSMRPQNEVISEEASLYDYWQVLKKRKRIFLSIFLIPTVATIVIGLNLPRYYRAECEITGMSMLTAPGVAGQISGIARTEKAKIFSNRAQAIKSVFVSFPQKSTDRLNIVAEAKTEGTAEQALRDVFHHIETLPEIRSTIEKMQKEQVLKREKFLQETDVQIGVLTNMKKENLIFLDQVKAMIKDKRLSVLSYNPADLIRKDADLSIEINKLQQAKRDATVKQAVNITLGILGPPSITRHPSNAQIRRVMVFVALLSLFVALVVIFFLEYLEKMNVLRNQRLA